MKNNYQDIERLLEKFLDGDTTNAEEKVLYDFFKSDNLPSHLSQYKDEFIFYGKCVKGINEKVLAPPKKNKSTMHRMLVIGISIAACLVMVVLFNLKTPGTEIKNPFEGSYIVSGNTIITDLKVIQSELEEDMKKIYAREKEIDNLVSKIMELDNLGRSISD